MRIACTSCMNTTAFKKQPVWKSIGDLKPDHLVLLGDSVCLNVPWAEGPVHPKQLSDNDVVAHAQEQYAAQLAGPEFVKLVRNVAAHAGWDDHDFLGNESCAERAISRQVDVEKIRATRSLFKHFVETLKQRLANRPSTPDLGAGKFLFDATASGAAGVTLVILGQPLQNFGVVDIGDDLVEVHFIGMGAPNRPRCGFSGPSGRLCGHRR